jgi:hypothetical protein
MITWATTVAPQTEAFSFSSASDVRRQNPGGGASITETRSGGATTQIIWSKTIYSTVGQVVLGGAGNTQYVLGTTNSTSWQTNSDGAEVNPSITVRSVVNQTSTQTTRQYTYHPTTTSTTATTTLGSTVSGTITTLGSFVPTTETYTSTFSGTVSTSSETCLSTTTVAQETVATPIFATVIVADKNEVIWVANTTAATATALSGISAASAVATSTTRTTIMPWTPTVTAVQANSTETTAVNLSAILAQFSYSQTAFAAFTMTEIEDYESLPHKTITDAGLSRSLSATQISATVAEAQTITVTKTAGTETRYVELHTTARAFANGAAFSSNGTTTGTIEREHAVPTAESSTFSDTEEVVAYLIPETWDNSEEDWTEYTWTQSFQSSTSNSLTDFARQSQGITTSVAVASTAYEARSGMVDSTGGISLGYSLNSTLGTGFGATKVSRYASSAFPSSGEFEQGGTSQNISASFSKLSVSLSFPGSTSTTTTTAVLSPFGAALSVRAGPSEWRSALNASGLGKSETVFITLPRGVYSANGSTFSTTGQTTSFASGNTASSAVPLPVSFIVPVTALASADKIWWTVSRNSHASLAGLTEAAAYSAA